MAVNCWGFPLATDGDAGVTAMDCREAAVTVKFVWPLTEPDVAEMTEVPIANVDARPREPLTLLIVAVAVVADNQVTWVVISAVEASEYVPVAVNCSGKPFATDGVPGVTAIETRAALVTVKEDVPEIEFNVAVIVDVPASTAESSPSEPLALLMVAVAKVPELHVTRAVILGVVPSE